MALSDDKALSDRTLPTTSSLLLIGVTKSVAMVPRSFSPAMDSGAIPIHPLYSIVMMMNGSIMAYRLASASCLVAIS